LTFLHGGAAVFHVYSADIPGQIQKGHRSGSGQVHIKSPSGACQTEADEYQVRVGPGPVQVRPPVGPDQICTKSMTDQGQVQIRRRSVSVGGRNQFQIGRNLIRSTKLPGMCLMTPDSSDGVSGAIRRNLTLSAKFENFRKIWGIPLCVGRSCRMVATKRNTSSVQRMFPRTP
jgi:hypothetical protein